MDEIEKRLLSEYVENGSEGAFRQIVERYAPLVYSAAYRRLGDHHLAEDASQAAFVVFARKAARLKRRVRLAGWFWQTALNAARHIERERIARAKREEKAVMLEQEADERVWERIAPELDGALQRLNTRTRDALIAHYLHGKTQAEIAGEWGVHVDAVRRKIKIGLDRLRKTLTARGTMVAPAVLIPLLTSRTAEAMPIELCDSIHKVAWGVSTGALALTGSVAAVSKGVMRMMTWAKIKIAVACTGTAAAVGGLTAVVAVQTGEPDYLWTSITPQPKEMKATGRTVPVAGGTIVLAGREPMLRIAAGEINHRLTDELGAAALAVTEGGPAEIQAARGPVIVIGVSGQGQMQAVEFAHRADVPAKMEGYAIAVHETGGKPVVVLSGHDAVGALYAAVTLRYLLETPGGAPVPNGKADLRLAAIRDWPDFPYRQIGRPPANVGIGWELKSASQKNSPNIDKIGAQFVQEMKQYVDYMLRHKINMTWSHATHLFNSGEGQCPYLRQVSDYARARGVYFVASASTEVGTYPRDKDDPRKSRCVDHRVHKKYFCWSLLDVHEERARETANLMKKSGMDWLYLHATDGGGWENPARWGERCEQCKKTYGDDHAKADAAVFGTWYRIIKEQIPDFKMIAVVYPYNGSSIDPVSLEKNVARNSGSAANAKALAGKIASSHQSFLTRLGTMLPEDVFICQRETIRRQYDLMTQCYGKRNFHCYLEIMHDRGWNPEFTMAPGWLKTFHRPGHADIFYTGGCAWGLYYMAEMMSAEFGWNVNAPGSKEFTNPSLRGYEIDHHIDPPDIARKHIRKLCNSFYGPEIGPYMVPVYDSNISYRFIQRPREVAAEMGLKEDPAARMQRLVEATQRAMASLEQARAVYDAALAAGRNPIPDPLAAKMFGEMYRAVLVSTYVAPFQQRLLQARPAVISGDMDKAKQLCAEARTFIAKGKAAWQQQWPWMNKTPINRRRNPNWVYTFGQFYEYDYSKREEEIAKFEQDMDRLFEAYNTPKWFKKAMQDRALYAVPAAPAPAIDGRLDEDAWASAPKNEYFVNHKTSTPAEKETEARLLFDPAGLYVGYTVYEPGADAIPIKARGRDDHNWNQTQSVELFVDANKDRETYVHYIWGIDGSILDGRKVRDARGMLAMDNKGFSSKARFAIARYPDRWTLEAFVPADELGARPKAGASWRANLCRNLVRADGNRESTSTVLMEGAGFHTPSKFAELEFLREPPPNREPVINFDTAKERAGQITIGDGTGFETVLNINLETTKPLHNASLNAHVWSGNARKGHFAVFEDQNIQLLWRSREPVRYVVDTPVPGVQVDFHLKANEGSWVFRRTFGEPPAREVKARFVPGVSGQALADTAHFPAIAQSGPVFDSRRGTLEMWVHVTPPADNEIRFGPKTDNVFFFQGPIRFDHPLLDNTRSVCLRRTGRNLTARVSTQEFQQLWTGASAGGWKEEGWHHVAMQWAATDEDSLSIDLFLDGKKASSKTNTNLHGKKWHLKAETYLVQLGSTVTGAGALGWPIDEVRISNAPRYSADFTPGKRATLDEKATIVFHFDGDLRGEARDGRLLMAHAGPGGT
ncbi:MAG: sigma-70 family RNA polymerase sigma factor [Kiritimatiellae bacterium]|nr:sigma-70 family RNA polymerase sigma factor [Kiritimatiellia bacterium]